MPRVIDVDRAIEVLEANPRIMTKDLAPLLGVAETTAGRWRKRLGYPAERYVRKVVHDDELKRMIEESPDLTLAELAERFGVEERTISRAKRRLNLTDEEHSKRIREAFATVEERVAKGMEMLADGAPLAEVERTLRMHSETLQRRHPEQRGWTREQSIEHAVAIRRLNGMERRAVPRRWRAA